MEWRLAAAWANYTWEQFCELDGDQMSAHIAAYRVDKQIVALLAHVQANEMRRQAPGHGSG